MTKTTTVHHVGLFQGVAFLFFLISIIMGEHASFAFVAPADRTTAPKTALFFTPATSKPDRFRVGATAVSRRAGAVYGLKKGSLRDNDEDESSGGTSSMWDTVRERPATLIALPFVAFFGFEIVLSIAAVTKQTVEVALTGEYTEWNPFASWLFRVITAGD